MLCFYGCLVTVNVLWLFPHGAVGWSAYLIAVFPDNTHLLFVYLGCSSYSEMIIWETVILKSIKPNIPVTQN